MIRRIWHKTNLIFIMCIIILAGVILSQIQLCNAAASRPTATPTVTPTPIEEEVEVVEEDDGPYNEPPEVNDGCVLSTDYNGGDEFTSPEGWSVFLVDMAFGGNDLNIIHFGVDDYGYAEKTFTGVNLGATPYLLLNILKQTGGITIRITDVQSGSFTYLQKSNVNSLIGLNAYDLTNLLGVSGVRDLKIRIQTEGYRTNIKVDYIRFAGYVDTANGLENTDLVGGLTSYDLDNMSNNSPNPIKYYIDTEPDNGKVTINENTGQFTYTPNPGYIGEDCFTYYVKDQKDESNTGGTVDIMINQKNHAPWVDMPETQYFKDNNKLVLAGRGVIIIDDIDAEFEPVSVTMSVLTGTLTLSKTDYLEFTEGDGIDDSKMAFTGNLDDIDNALEGMIYDPAINNPGRVQLKVYVNDNGNIGEGGPLSDSKVLDIMVEDGTPPEVVSVDIPPPGTYKYQERLNFTVHFDEKVYVTGSPFIYIKIGENTRRAEYYSGDETDTIVFSYLINAVDSALEGIEPEGSLVIKHDMSITDFSDNSIVNRSLGVLDDCSEIIVDSIPKEPDVSISFDGENANKLMGSDKTMEFSVDGESTWIPVTSENMNLSRHIPKMTAENGIKVRGKAKGDVIAGNITNINISSGAQMPEHSIDYVKEKTNEDVPINQEYSLDNFASKPIKGNGYSIKLIPGKKYYFRVPGHGNQLPSPVFMLECPDRPQKPDYSIDFNTAQTVEEIPAEVVYAGDTRFNFAKAGEGKVLELLPGSELYFKVAEVQGSSFASDIFKLAVPQRPKTPLITTDYVTMKSKENVSSAIEYSTKPDFSNSNAGSNAPVDLLPGTVNYFRVMATDASFASEICVVRVAGLPSFIMGDDQNYLEDCGPKVIVGWAHGIANSSGTDSGEKLAFEVREVSNPSIFKSQPEILSDGTLKFTPKAETFGSSTVTIVLGNGTCYSAEQTFNINIEEVNDPPTVSIIKNQVINENGILSDVKFTVNDVDTPIQNLDVTAISTDQSIVMDSDITISGSDKERTLEITPRENAYGKVEILVKVSDGDKSASTEFDLTINKTFDKKIEEDKSDMPVVEEDKTNTTVVEEPVKEELPTDTNVNTDEKDKTPDNTPDKTTDKTPDKSPDKTPDKVVPPFNNTTLPAVDTTDNGTAKKPETVEKVEEVIDPSKIASSAVRKVSEAMRVIKSAQTPEDAESAVTQELDAIADVANGIELFPADRKRESIELIAELLQRSSRLFDLITSQEDTTRHIEQIISSTAKLTAIKDNTEILSEALKKLAQKCIEKIAIEEVAVDKNADGKFEAIIDSKDVDKMQKLIVDACRTTRDINGFFEHIGASVKMDSYIMLNLPKNIKSREIIISLPQEIIKIAKGEGLDKIVYNSHLAEVSIKPDVVGPSDAAYLRLFIKRMDRSEVSDKQIGSVSGSSIYDFKLMLDEVPVGNMPQLAQISIPYEVRFGESPYRMTVMYVDENGKTENMGALYSDVERNIKFMTRHFSLYYIIDNQVNFADTQNVSWALPFIDGMSAKGVIKGVSEKRFEPQANITRAQFVTMLVNAFKLQSSGAFSAYMDVTDNAWYKPFVMAAYENSLINRNAVNFRPNDNISRQEMAVIGYSALLKFSNRMKPKSAREISDVFADCDSIEEYAKEAVGAVYKMGVIKGRENMMFAPRAFATRAEATVIISNLTSLNINK